MTRRKLTRLFFVCCAEDGQALGDDTADVEQDVLEMLGFDEWEGVAVGFLLAKVYYDRGSTGYHVVRLWIYNPAVASLPLIFDRTLRYPRSCAYEVATCSLPQRYLC